MENIFFPFLVENSRVAFLMRNCFAKQHCRRHDVIAKRFGNRYFYEQNDFNCLMTSTTVSPKLLIAAGVLPTVGIITYSLQQAPPPHIIPPAHSTNQHFVLLSRAVLLEVIAIVVLLLYWSRAFNLEYSINNKIRKEIYNSFTIMQKFNQIGVFVVFVSSCSCSCLFRWKIPKT